MPPCAVLSPEMITNQIITNWDRYADRETNKIGAYGHENYKVVIIVLVGLSRQSRFCKPIGFELKGTEALLRYVNCLTNCILLSGVHVIIDMISKLILKKKMTKLMEIVRREGNLHLRSCWLLNIFSFEQRFS